MSRAARNSDCCGHAPADHDLLGCAVNLATESRTYVRCHGLVEIDAVRHAIEQQIDEETERLARIRAFIQEAESAR